MTLRHHPRTREPYIIGPSGAPLSLRDLPPADESRWVIRRKAEVVAAVRHGLISMVDALERYRISLEEFAGWEQAVAAHGLAGLRVTRLQDHRRRAS